MGAWNTIIPPQVDERRLPIPLVNNISDMTTALSTREKYSIHVGKLVE